MAIALVHRGRIFALFARSQKHCLQRSAQSSSAEAYTFDD